MSKKVDSEGCLSDGRLQRACSRELAATGELVLVRLPRQFESLWHALRITCLLRGHSVAKAARVLQTKFEYTHLRHLGLLRVAQALFVSSGNSTSTFSS